MKNITSRGIALLTSVILAGLVLGLHLFFSNRYTGEFYFLDAFLFSSAVFISSYLLIYFFVEKFIYSRVKLIYKTIYSKKLNKETKQRIAKSEDILNEVNAEVSSWVQDRQQEIKKLKDQEEYRREFLGNLAHELKTPVFSIQGYILTLLEGGLEDPNINVSFLQRAAKGVDRITHIIEDLDTITKLESAKLDLDIRKLNIVELADEVIDSLEMKAAERKIHLGFNRNYDKAIYVECDRGRIGQVLTNLLANSINYGKEGGKTDIRFFDMDDKILVEVADNGPGIPEKDLPRIFERFYRVDKSRARHQGGSGLGLAIVKHILEAHEQTIHVRSTENEGTTFAFTLQKA
jgi:two-component system, OmpR family, phosphate regulon sensor histidine kinase PhoR